MLVEAPSGQPRDSTVTVRIRVQETPQRLLTGEAGYVSAGGGITGQAEFAHRNFMGGASTLRLNARAQTGEWSLLEEPQREYRLSATYRRPFTLLPRMTLTLSPFGGYSDNLLDRSWEYGFSSTLLYQLRKYSFLTAEYRYTSRRVLDYRVGSANSADLAQLIELIGAGALDSLENRIDRSTVSLSGTFGRFDPTIRRMAIQGRPSAEVTVPSALNTIEYASLDYP